VLQVKHLLCQTLRVFVQVVSVDASDFFITIIAVPAVVKIAVFDFLEKYKCIYLSRQAVMVDP